MGCGMRMGTWCGLSCAHCCTVLERRWTLLSSRLHSLERSTDSDTVRDRALNCQHDS
jgi:hypothetical protein